VYIADIQHTKRIKNLFFHSWCLLSHVLWVKTPHNGWLLLSPKRKTNSLKNQNNFCDSKIQTNIVRFFAAAFFIKKSQKRITLNLFKINLPQNNPILKNRLQNVFSVFVERSCLVLPVFVN
jgi:hypothetical protein